MSFTNRIRGGLMATAAGAGLLAMGGASTAAEYNVGDVKVTLDTTISLGASIRTADRNDAFLPESNGGHFDPRSAGTVLPTVGAATNLLGLALPADVTITGNTNNFDGSINTDEATRIPASMKYIPLMGREAPSDLPDVYLFNNDGREREGQPRPDAAVRPLHGLLALLLLL